jgi:hypothetical protein
MLTVEIREPESEVTPENIRYTVYALSLDLCRSIDYPLLGF